MPRGVPRVAEPREWVLQKTCTGPCGQTKPWAKFAPRKYWPDGSVRVVATVCHVCDAEASKVRSRKYRQENRAKLIAYKLEWRRQRREQMDRESANNAERIPARPLKVLLWRSVMGMETPSWLDLAEQCGVADRSLRRVLSQENVSMQFADQICTHLGARLYDLYPELEELAA